MRRESMAFDRAKEYLKQFGLENRVKELTLVDIAAVKQAGAGREV